jgi:hypothetical protein
VLRSLPLNKTYGRERIEREDRGGVAGDIPCCAGSERRVSSDISCMEGSVIRGFGFFTFFGLGSSEVEVVG